MKFDIKYAFLFILVIGVFVAMGGFIGDGTSPYSGNALQWQIQKKLQAEKEAQGLGSFFGSGAQEGMTQPTLPSRPSQPPQQGTATGSIPVPAGIAAGGSQPPPPIAYVPPPPPALTGQDFVPSFYLKDGRRVFFSGQLVFVLGSSGQLGPLPDGRYDLQNGGVVTVRGGKRQMTEKDLVNPGTP